MFPPVHNLSCTVRVVDNPMGPQCKIVGSPRMFMSGASSPHEREARPSSYRTVSGVCILCLLLPLHADSTIDEEKTNIKHGVLHVDDVEADAAKGQHVKVDEKMSAFESVRRLPKSIACCCFMLFTCIVRSHDGMAGSSMATIGNGASNALWSLSLPYMVSPDQTNMGGKVA
ncbi:hypothetical protein PMIN06_009766 [Paraphaeosphaeria minitans]|uniref:Maltose permease n=1 Tax=Paraphaeosphaeria minitans TaxID=565426 RepID=A0A9P6GTF5_9PLEO|nr:maltose permease [Paraphaeosphaeria minitans]